MVSFPLPDADGRARILGVYLDAIEHHVDTALVADATEGMSGADLRELVRSGLLGVEGIIATEDLLAQIPDPDRDPEPPPPASPVRSGGRYL
ncbi:MAG TPA: hypothetical protein VFI59_01885 [Actinomycetota bacterium]|nr:hypothetical protein [Actinomycetota bacterium]